MYMYIPTWEKLCHYMTISPRNFRHIDVPIQTWKKLCVSSQKAITPGNNKQHACFFIPTWENDFMNFFIYLVLRFPVMGKLTYRLSYCFLLKPIVKVFQSCTKQNSSISI